MNLTQKESANDVDSQKTRRRVLMEASASVNLQRLYKDESFVAYNISDCSTA